MTKQSKLQELFDNAAANAARIFNESGEVLPMWHAVYGNDENVLIATPWSGDEEKQIAVDMLRHLFRRERVKRFAFIVEAWTATSRAEDIAAKGEGYVGPPPSEHPDRREVLMITAEDHGSSIMGFYYILRPEHGKAVLSPLHIQPFDRTAGRMVGLLT
jgi:hypothetical protein